MSSEYEFVYNVPRILSAFSTVFEQRVPSQSSEASGLNPFNNRLLADRHMPSLDDGAGQIFTDSACSMPRKPRSMNRFAARLRPPKTR